MKKSVPNSAGADQLLTKTRWEMSSGGLKTSHSTRKFRIR